MKLVIWQNNTKKKEKLTEAVITPYVLLTHAHIHERSRVFLTTLIGGGITVRITEVFPVHIWTTRSSCHH